ncbi:MAG TPA: quinolinate synthase NadA [Phycisphaerales bacterium]|nr:quinolinate synthase NadA [Phycisphaerales bacterium]
MLWQPSLPDVYTKTPAGALADAIAERRRELGESVVILGHHYQTDEIIRHADITGDSLKLSQAAAGLVNDPNRRTPLRAVVFCGVHFMAETADMLTPDEVAVILPDISAGCSMADMAQYDDTVQAWEEIHAALREQGWEGVVVPITYVNSSAAIKAFVGEHGGACCTSSNALEVFSWAMGGGPPLRGGSSSAPSAFGLHSVPTELDSLDFIPCHPVGFRGRDPYPKGSVPPADMRSARRALPHLELEGATYFVTWKTHHDRPMSDAEMAVVLEVLSHWDGERCRVYAASVMNTHVHWLVRPFEGHSLSDLVTSVKRFASKQLNDARGERGNVWNDEWFDHVIRDERGFSEKFLYTIRNPVVAGLVGVASQYPWTRVHPDAGWPESSRRRPSIKTKQTPRSAPEGRTTKRKVLFLPDQHLGRNTAARFGIDVANRSCMYDPRLTRRGVALGGATPEQLLNSDVILWAGHCSVHKLFRPEHCDAVREQDAKEGTRTAILVHPECAKEVVDRADLNGSTEFIIRTIRAAAPGSRWAVGTEIHLVNRLAREAAERGVHVRILSDCQCLCTTMYRIDQPHLLWVLDNLAGRHEERVGSGKAGKPRIVNEVKVLPKVRELALLAIDRMLALSDAPQRAHVRLAALAKAD